MANFCGFLLNQSKCSGVEEGRDLFPLVRRSFRNFVSTPLMAAVNISEQKRLENIGKNTAMSSLERKREDNEKIKINSLLAN